MVLLTCDGLGYGPIKAMTVSSDESEPHRRMVLWQEEDSVGVSGW